MLTNWKRKLIELQLVKLFLQLVLNLTWCCNSFWCCSSCCFWSCFWCWCTTGHSVLSSTTEKPYFIVTATRRQGTVYTSETCFLVACHIIVSLVGEDVRISCSTFHVLRETTVIRETWKVLSIFQ